MMEGRSAGSGGVVVLDGSDVAVVAASVTTLTELSRLLRQLRRREARSREGAELTYRELAARMNCSVTTIGEYLTGVRLAPTDRFDVLVQVLGATQAELHAFATARDRVADAQYRAGTGPMDGPPVPRELPAGDSMFLARESELAGLDELLAADDAAPAKVAVVSGMAGVGKTALAVEWARRVSDRFPDGQLFVNLRGYDPEEPVDSGAALAAFLRSLGMDSAAVPADLDERAARFRSLVAERRVLVLLDNASSAEQVRPLLPGARSCAVVVTSRDDLAGLVASPGAGRLDLGPLTLGGAEALLRKSIGERAAADPLATAALAQRCGRLPLALRIAAELVTGRAGTGLAALVAELADADVGRDEAPSQLQLFDTTGDSRTSVRSVFSWSLRGLPAEVSRAFVLLGLHPGGDIDGHAVAALVGVGVADAQSLVRPLMRAHLVDQDGADRYAMHDLLRAYAAEQALVRLTPDERRAGLTRLFDYYRQVSEAASSVRYPGSGGSRHSGTPAAAPELADPQRARAWLDAERSNLVAVCRYAASRGWFGHTIALSVALWPYLDQGYNHEALAVHTSAADAARAGGGDPATCGRVLTHLGLTYWRLGRPADALAQLQEALSRHREVGNREGIGRTLAALGIVYDTLGRYATALECNDHGLANARELGDRFAEARHLINLGHGHLRLEQYESAEDYYEQAGSIGEHLDDPRIRAVVDHGLGIAYHGLGRYEEALELLQRALEFYREFGEQSREIRVLEAIAGLYQRLGRLGEAFSNLDEALALSRRLDDEAGRVVVLNTWGETFSASGDFALAGDRHREALRLARRIGDRLQQARALDGLGDGHHGAGDLAIALGHWQRAQIAYSELGHPAAARIRAKIEDARARRGPPTTGV